MDIIKVNIANQHYPVYVGKDILSEFAGILKNHYKTKQVALITTESIYKLHGGKLVEGLKNDYDVLTLFVPEGEGAKSLEQAQKLFTQLLENKFERNAVIVAFGGGIAGDLAGFIAAAYLRGVAFVQIPTTLLAQVDSSIGGKVGVNHPLGKNLIGAFKQPLFVFSDIALLKTLPDSEIRCGMGEVVKYGFILSSDFFKYLEDNLDKALQKDEDVLLHLVKTSAAEKGKIVDQDEKEQGLRMILNFGHTFGHALEAEYKFSGLKHGEAVILGMKCALAYAQQKNILENKEYRRGITLLNRIPVKYDRSQINPDRLVECMALDKKVKNKTIRLVLIEKIGKHWFDFVDNPADLKNAYDILLCNPDPD
ncbi:MAG: 3-dehydroquinate synthase [Calditrichales bacterium]|nr:3-dehydroquinate synthase [Calditrichales bacterium]